MHTHVGQQTFGAAPIPSELGLAHRIHATPTLLGDCGELFSQMALNRLNEGPGRSMPRLLLRPEPRGV